MGETDTLLFQNEQESDYGLLRRVYGCDRAIGGSKCRLLEHSFLPVIYEAKSADIVSSAIGVIRRDVSGYGCALNVAREHKLGLRWRGLANTFSMNNGRLYTCWVWHGQQSVSWPQ